MPFDPRRGSSGNGAFLISSARQQGITQAAQALPPRSLNPALRRLHKFRTSLLPVLLMFTFTTLVLGAIYAYCVARPENIVTDRLPVDRNAKDDLSIFGKRAASPKSRSEVALLFYTLAVPGLSLFDQAFELIMHHHTPRYFGLRSVYITLLTTSSLLICGWITTISFWMHCELTIFNKDKARQAVCPAQARGHFMYGIHEVSIARIVVAWIIVLFYIGHVVLLGLGYTAQKRIWRIIGGGKAHGDVETSLGEAQIVVIKFEDDSNEVGAGLAKEANVI